MKPKYREETNEKKQKTHTHNPGINHKKNVSKENKSNRRKTKIVPKQKKKE